MKPINLKKLSIRLSTFMVLIIAAFIIHSCKKDSKFIQLSAGDSVNQAKTWYESTYPVNNALSVNNNLTTLGVNRTGNTQFDYSQYIKPDWNHAGKYKRFGKDVIEMPVDPGKVLNYGLKNANTGQLTSAKENSRAWFLLLNDGKAYSAYIMVLIGDPGYINGDPSKMAKNSYRKRDANFSGMLVYFTPKGQFIRSYKYVNGQQVTPASSIAAASTQQTQSTGKKTNKAAYVDCDDWYWMVYDSNGNIVSLDYMYTICVDVPGDGGGDPGSGGGGAPSPPPTCQVTHSVSHLAVNVAQPPPGDPGDGSGDPGYPDPTQGSACSATITTNNVQNTCLRNMVNATINTNITTVINTMIQNVFAKSDKVNLDFEDSMQLGSGTMGYTPPPPASPNGIYNQVINLNANQLPYYSQEFIASVIMHESIHAYLTSIGTAGVYQHEDMMLLFVTQMAADLQQMFPNLGDTDAKNLALGGLDATDAFKTQIASDLSLQGSYDATKLAFTIGPAGTRCH